MTFKTRLLSTALVLVASASTAGAATVSYRGMLDADDDLRRFDFSLEAMTEVTIRTFSYAGGIQGDGTIVAAGGFDPSLALFQFDSGGLIAEQDDARNSDVPRDPTTGLRADAKLMLELIPGDYFVILSQSLNFPLGPRDFDGFTQEGTGNFTASFGCVDGAFCGLTGEQRSGAFAFDISGPDRAVSTPMAPIPLPATALLLAAALALLGASSSRRRG